MVWTQSARDVCFQTDQDFISLYCTPTTHARLVAGGVPIATARCVISAMTLRLSRASHATPELWTPRSQPQPIVVMGARRRCKSGWSIWEKKIGLCAHGGQLFLFASERRLRSDFGRIPPGWVSWRTDGRGSQAGHYLRFDRPLACHNGKLVINVPDEDTLDGFFGDWFDGINDSLSDQFGDDLPEDLPEMGDAMTPRRARNASPLSR